jgi:hypothetical protein
MFSGGYTAYESSVLYRQFKASVQHPKIEVLLASLAGSILYDIDCMGSTDINNVVICANKSIYF